MRPVWRPNRDHSVSPCRMRQRRENFTEASAIDTAFPDEPMRIEGGKWAAQLVQFGSRAVKFKADQLGQCQGFGQKSGDIIEVSEGSLAIDIGFATEDVATIDGEFVIDRTGFGRGLLDKAVGQGFEGVEVSRMRAKVGVNTDQFGSGAHGRIALRELERVRALKQADRLGVCGKEGGTISDSHPWNAHDKLKSSTRRRKTWDPKNNWLAGWRRWESGRLTWKSHL